MSKELKELIDDLECDLSLDSKYDDFYFLLKRSTVRKILPMLRKLNEPTHLGNDKGKDEHTHS